MTSWLRVLVRLSLCISCRKVFPATAESALNTWWCNLEVYHRRQKHILLSRICTGTKFYSVWFYERNYLTTQIADILINFESFCTQTGIGTGWFFSRYDILVIWPDRLRNYWHLRFNSVILPVISVSFSGNRSAQGKNFSDIITDITYVTNVTLRYYCTSE